jgi:hypothetical protein
MPTLLPCAFVDAAQEIGFTMNNDFNGAEQVGFGFYQVTQYGLETG